MANVKNKSGSSSSRSKPRSNTNKKPVRGSANSRENGRTKQAKISRELGRDISGVVLVIIGLLLGIFCYFGSTGLLSGIAPVLFGLFGVAAYALPIVLIAVGILLIAIPKSGLSPATIVCITVMVLTIITLIHVAYDGNALASSRFGAAVSGAYSTGRLHHGGGFFGGVFGFIFVKLLGVTGSIITLIGIIIIAVLLITHFSIGAHFRRLRENLRQEPSPSRKKQKVYNYELQKQHYDDADYFDPDGDDGTDGFIEHSGRPLTSGDTDYDYEPSSRIKSRANTPVEPRRERIKAAGFKSTKPDDGPQFLPMSGPLSTVKPSKKRSRKSRELIGSFNTVSGSGSYGADDYYDPDYDGESGGTQTSPAEADASGGAFDPLDGVVISRYDDRLSDAGSASADGVSGPLNEASGRSGADSAADGASDASDVSGTDGADETIIPVAPAVVYEYQRPPLSLLRLPDPASGVASEPPEEKARILIETLKSFNISARIVNISVGPVITRYELQPAQGVRVNRITSLSNDIALALAAPRVRIEAPIPGKSAIGIEIPNRSTVTVLLRELLESSEFNAAKSPLTFALGKDIAGNIVLGDLGKMPHMLVAGQTGSGKSVCINDIVLSLIYKSSPKDVRMILIDPKVVELSIFSTLPHLFCPVVTEPKKAAGALRWAVNEMDQRYKLMASAHARDIDRYNAIQTDEDKRWPRLVIIIDELADLMIVASKDVEDSICRIAQLGRACGIHLIVATQRPSVDVITGLIKANIPSRIAFAVSNGTDSRVILDTVGAEKLLGRGDMLFHPNGASKPTRAQGAFVGDEEVEAVAEFFTSSAAERPDFHEEMLTEITSSGASTGQGNGKQEDELLPDAVRLVIESGAASISMIQRRLRVGYARAARLIDIMEQKGYVSPADGAKPRNVLISAAEYNNIFGGDIPVGGGE